MLSPQICRGHGIEPLYKKIAGVPENMLRTWIAAAAQREAAEVPEVLPESLRQKHNLCTYSEAILQAHAPESREKLAAAKRYLAFEQLIIYQLALGSMRTGVRPGGSSSITDTSRSPYMTSASVRGMGVALMTSVLGL